MPRRSSNYPHIFYSLLLLYKTLILLPPIGRKYPPIRRWTTRSYRSRRRRAERLRMHCTHQERRSSRRSAEECGGGSGEAETATSKESSKGGEGFQPARRGPHFEETDEELCAEGGPDGSQVDWPIQASYINLPCFFPYLLVFFFSESWKLTCSKERVFRTPVLAPF